MSTGLHRVRVFTDADGRYGNDLAIVRDGQAHGDAAAQEIAATAGTSETVFIDDAVAGRVRIYVPRTRVPFAGHPLVGVAWFLHREGCEVVQLMTDAGPVEARADDAGASISTTAGRGVPWALHRCARPRDVEAADPSGEGRHDYVWSWVDEPTGLIRARAFASVSGTREDEATGSAAVQLAHHLGRSVRIVQGRGSQIEVERNGSIYTLAGRVVDAN